MLKFGVLSNSNVPKVITDWKQSGFYWTTL